MNQTKNDSSAAPRARHCYVAYVVIRLVVGCLLASAVANAYQPGWEHVAGIVSGWLIGSAMKEMFPSSGLFIMHNAKVPWLD